jgi:hypothetical protein
MDPEDLETVTITYEADGDSEELTVPLGLIDLLREEGETTAEVVSEVSLFAFAQHIHGALHHSQDEPTEKLEAVEQATMDLFEERFGATYGELTGHSH